MKIYTRASQASRCQGHISRCAQLHMNSFFSDSSAFKFRLASQSHTEFFSLGEVIEKEQQKAAPRNIYMTVLSLS